MGSGFLSNTSCFLYCETIVICNSLIHAISHPDNSTLSIRGEEIPSGNFGSSSRQTWLSLNYLLR